MNSTPIHALFLLFIFLLLCSSAASAQVAGRIDAVVAENGNAFVLLALTGEGTANIPLPLDADAPVVSGALYVQKTNGIDVSLAQGDDARVAYKTSLLTVKEGRDWVFELSIPDLSQATVVASLPANAAVLETTPEGQILPTKDSMNVQWTTAEAGTVSCRYRFETSPLSTIPREESVEAETESPLSPFFAFLAIVLVFVVVAAAVILIKRRGGVSDEKQQVLKTLTPNELKVVTLLLDNDGAMKRNALESEAKMAKSSLASVLASLEKRNIVDVDRSQAVHFVELSAWFKVL